MLRWVRFRARATAAGVLLAIVALSVSAPHGSDHDEHTSAAITLHDASAHRVAGAPPDASDNPLHCAVCHWARSFRPDLRTSHQLAAPEDLTLVSQRIASRPPLVFPAAQPPLRGPPAPATVL